MTTLQIHHQQTARDLRAIEQSKRMMLSGAIRMPQDMAMQDPISRAQFYRRANQALDLLTAQDATLDHLQAQLRDILDQLRRTQDVRPALLRVEGQLHNLLATMF